MSSAPESVKLFVSSTFEDMHAERDRLNRFVFPEVRRRCREIGVDFLAVDLRWGVTREEAERQETTNLCLREVDRCLPFFIGLIGDRYGWIPAPERVPLTDYRAAFEAGGEDQRALLERAYALDETTGVPAMRLIHNAVADDDVRLRVVRLWEAAGLPGAGKSLTEIEIDRALDAADSRAHFYLREPPVHIHPDFPETLLPVFTSPDGEPRRRLMLLKMRLVEHQGARRYAPRYAGMRVDSTYLPKGLSGRSGRCSRTASSARASSTPSPSACAASSSATRGSRSRVSTRWASRSSRICGRGSRAWPAPPPARTGAATSGSCAIARGCSSGATTS